MKSLIGFIGGSLFAFGLVVSGMTNPNKVIGFLDIFGKWDYSLAFVMGGAVLINIVTFYFILKKKPLFDQEYSLPKKSRIDKPLVLGASLFGIGWGLVGICPGPGIVNLVTLDPFSLLFMVSLVFGMLIHKLFV